MQSIRKQVIQYLYSFKDNEFHELNSFLKTIFPNEHIVTIKDEIQSLSVKKKIEVENNNHVRWTQYTSNIEPDHNVIADLDNWKVYAKITTDYREVLDAEEIEVIKNKSDEEFQKLQTEVLRLEKEELELKRKNQELNTEYQKSQQQLTLLQIKEIKTKRVFAILGAVGGIIITLITEYLLGVLKLK